MITNKRGQEQLLLVVIQLVVVALFLILVVYFINSTASGKLVKNQIISKQIAMLLDSANPGTTIAIVSESDLTLTINSVKSQILNNNLPYEYEFYNPSNINIKKEGAGSYILTVK
jgi:hypothetical protein